MNIANLEQMISDLKEKESYHQQEIAQLNQTISDASQQEIKYKTEIENFRRNRWLSLLKRKRSRNKLVENFKLEIENYNQMIAHLSEQESRY